MASALGAKADIADWKSDNYTNGMIKNFIGFTLVLAGPWLVLLTYIHFVRQYWDSSTSGYFSLALAFGLGIFGAKLLEKIHANWPLHFKVLGIVIFTVALAFYVVYVGLMSACSAGDCL